MKEKEIHEKVICPSCKEKCEKIDLINPRHVCLNCLEDDELFSLLMGLTYELGLRKGREKDDDIMERK